MSEAGRSTSAGHGPVTAFDAIAARRNVREYAARSVTAADLDQILEAGRRAP